jgi:hypothetical protein
MNDVGEPYAGERHVRFDRGPLGMSKPTARRNTHPAGNPAGLSPSRPTGHAEPAAYLTTRHAAQDIAAVCEGSPLTGPGGLEITVCHYPPGTSKWNKIEHRMFSFISMSWRGRPLESYRTIVELIGATTTTKGLRIRAERDDGYYETGVKVSDKELAALPLTRHEFHGEWNYTLTPKTAQSNVR